MRLNAVRNRRFAQRRAFRDGNPNGFAIPPNGQGTTVSLMVLNYFDDGIGESLHRLLCQR